MRIKAITLWEPWATLLALGEKVYETRSWGTDYRGPVAIHAAQRWTQALERAVMSEPFSGALARHGLWGNMEFPLGCVVAVADLTAVYRTEDMRASLSSQELAFGDYVNGRLAWKLENVRRLTEPVQAKGKQGLWWWDVPEHLVDVL